jgi:hypothetical protein
MTNVQKHINCINRPASQTFRPSETAYQREVPEETLVQVRAYEGAQREPVGARRLLAT